MFAEALNEDYCLPLLYHSEAMSAAQVGYAQDGYKCAMLQAAEEDEQAIARLERARESCDPKLVSIGVDPN